MTRRSRAALRSSTRITNYAVLQHFIARQMPIPLCPAQVRGRHPCVCATPRPQPPQISEGDTNQISSSGGKSLSAHSPSADETKNIRQYSVWFQKRSTTALFAPSGALQASVHDGHTSTRGRARCDAIGISPRTPQPNEWGGCGRFSPSGARLSQFRIGAPTPGVGYPTLRGSRSPESALSRHPGSIRRHGTGGDPQIACSIAMVSIVSTTS